MGSGVRDMVGRAAGPSAPPSRPSPTMANPVVPSTAASPAPSIPELPVHLTRFVGRGRELDDLEGLVGAARLVTLTGAGGSGKTRLARETALRLAGAFQRTAW